MRGCQDWTYSLLSLFKPLLRTSTVCTRTLRSASATFAIYIDYYAVEEAKQARAIPVNLTLSSCKEKSRLQAKFAANVGSSGEGPEINNSLKLLNVFGRLESLNITRQGQGDEKHLLVSLFHFLAIHTRGNLSQTATF